MSDKRHRDSAQLHDAKDVRGRAQLEVALGPALEQQQHNVKQEEAGVGAHAAEGKTASELAVGANSADAASTCSCTRDADLDVTRGYAGERREEGE